MKLSRTLIGLAMLALACSGKTRVFDETTRGADGSGSSGGETIGAGGDDAAGDSSFGGLGGAEIGEGEGTGGAESNEKGPRIVETSPANQETGVDPQAVIRIMFDRPMNRLSVQGAFQSSDLPVGSVTFDWNDAGTIFTVTPNAALEITESTDPSAAAKKYTFKLTSIAEDMEGNRLPADEFEFSTIRQITGKIAASSTIHLRKYDTPTDGKTFYARNTIVLGRHYETSGWFRAWWTFDLKTIPAESEIIGATVQAGVLDEKINSWSVLAAQKEKVNVFVSSAYRDQMKGLGGSFTESKLTTKQLTTIWETNKFEARKTLTKNETATFDATDDAIEAKDADGFVSYTVRTTELGEYNQTVSIKLSSVSLSVIYLIP